jgi:hypothetical protein
MQSQPACPLFPAVTTQDLRMQQQAFMAGAAAPRAVAAPANADVGSLPASLAGASALASGTSTMMGMGTAIGPVGAVPARQTQPAEQHEEVGGAPPPLAVAAPGLAPAAALEPAALALGPGRVAPPVAGAGPEGEGAGEEGMGEEEQRALQLAVEDIEPGLAQFASGQFAEGGEAGRTAGAAVEGPGEEEHLPPGAAKPKGALGGSGGEAMAVDLAPTGEALPVRPDAWMLARCQPGCDGSRDALDRSAWAFRQSRGRGRRAHGNQG